jgi:GDP-mannose:di-myo-inositol-1,3'-phosphate beta-1,2-mannosyltransferase
MMTRWNVPCGVSVHAEPLGRALVEMGHKLKVFAPIEWQAHQTQEDEPYVTRCYRLDSGWRDWEGFFLNPQPFLEEDYDFFVIQNLELMPMPELFQIFPKIKAKAKTILVIHEGKAPNDPYFYQIEPDAVVCFDERYEGYLSKIYPKEKIFIIPYVCHPVEHGDKFEARFKLDLPINKKIIFNYGVGVDRNAYLVPTIERLSQKYPILFLVLTHQEEHFGLFEALAGKYKCVEMRRGIASTKRIYTYLHASDATIFHKPPAQAIVVSSTVFECLGAGCPILVLDSNFVETLSNEVLKYKDFEDMGKKLADVFEEKAYVKESLKAAEAYVMKNSSYEIAKRFIDLFEFLGTGAKVPTLDLKAGSGINVPQNAVIPPGNKAVT